MVQQKRTGRRSEKRLYPGYAGQALARSLSRAESRDVLKSDLDEHFRNILNEQEGMPFCEDIDFELDLMVSDAVNNFDIYTKLGARRIVFHIEAVGDLKEFKNFIEGMDMYIREAVEIGVALNIKTPVEQIFPLANDIDFVQFMGIENVGFQGQEFDDQVLEKISDLRQGYPNIAISIDGGVSLDTAPDLISAGATRLISGSAVFESGDIARAIDDLSNSGE